MPEATSRPTSASMLPAIIDLAASDAAGTAELRRFLADGAAAERSEWREVRDAALRSALAVISPAPSWGACLALSEGIARFESRIWPRLAAGASTADLGPMDAELLRARLAGRLPRTARQLYSIFRSEALEISVGPGRQ